MVERIGSIKGIIFHVLDHVMAGEWVKIKGTYSDNKGVHVTIGLDQILITYQATNWLTEDGVKNIIETMDTRSALLFKAVKSGEGVVASVGSVERKTDNGFSYWQEMIKEYVKSYLGDFKEVS